MSNRFHSKYHRKNHHTYGNSTNPDASHDPIASPEQPFLGDFSLQGALCAVAPASAYAGYFYSNNTALCAIGSKRGIFASSPNLGIASYSLNTPLSTAFGKNILHGVVGINKNTVTNNYVLDVLGNTNLDGNLNVVGDVDIDGGDLTASTSTFNLLNTSPTTTINFGAQATTIQIAKADATSTVNINGTKDSTACTNGALVVDGGVGISKNLNVCGNISTSGGGNVDGNLVVKGDVDIQGCDLASSTCSTFNLLNTSPTTTINFGGNSTSIQIAKADATSTVNINGTKDSTSKTTGALVIDGGVGIAKTLTVEDIVVEDDVIVKGNLTVNGDYTYLNTKVEVTSAILVENKGTGPAITVKQLGANDIAHFIDDGATSLIIKDGGNVGIGTFSPNEKLTVMGRVSATGFRSNQGIPSNSNSSTNGYAFATDGDTGLFSPIVAGGQDNGVVSLFSNGSEQLRANNGAVNIYGSLTTTGNLVVGGTITNDPKAPVTTTIDYPVTQADHDKTILANHATNTINIKLPTGLKAGTQVSVIRVGAGVVQFSQGTGLPTILSTPNNDFKKLAFENSAASAYWSGTRWYLVGDLLS